MSDFGLFDSFDSSEHEQRTAAVRAQGTIDRAIHAAKERFGDFLRKSSSKEDFEDRWALVKNEALTLVAEVIEPKPSVMRKVKGALKGKTAFNPDRDDDHFSSDQENASYKVDPIGYAPSGVYEADPEGESYFDSLMTSAPTNPHDAARKTASHQTGWWSRESGAVWVSEGGYMDGGTGDQIGTASTALEALDLFGLAGYIRTDNLGPTPGIPSTYSCTLTTAVTADTKVDPTHLPESFDDEGGTTNLDPSGRDTSPKDASKHADKGKKLEPKADWEGYLRDRAADGKKVRKNNFASIDAQVLRDFPELRTSRTVTANDWFQKGKDAYAAGASRAPALNREVMDAIGGAGVGDPETNRIMSEWGRGWDAANMADDSFLDDDYHGGYGEHHANTEPHEISPPLSGTDAQELDDESDTLQPTKVETQPKDANKKSADVLQSWGGGLGDGYEYNILTEYSNEYGDKVYTWTIEHGNGNVVAQSDPGGIPVSQMSSNEVRWLIDDVVYDLKNGTYTAGKKTAEDTKVAPPRPSDDYDDEGGTTNLAPAGEPTQPKDAALAAAWREASATGMSLEDFAFFEGVSVSAARMVAHVPFDRRRADAADTWRNDEDLEAERANQGTIKHFSSDDPNYIDGVGVSDAQWEMRAEDNMFDYLDWFNEVGHAHYTSHGTESLNAWLEAEHSGMTDRERAATVAEFALSFTSGKRKTAGYNSGNWRTYAPGAGPAANDGWDVLADYYDALYPAGNPWAVVVDRDNYGEYDTEVYDGNGGLVDSKSFYDVAEAQTWASKLLEKTYKGEAKGDKGQGKFFTTPGVGKLFGSRTRTAASITVNDLVEMDDGWYMYEPSNAPELMLTERSPDLWDIEVSFMDGTSQDQMGVSAWNDPDAKAAAVEFYNRVASRTRVAAVGIQPIGQSASVAKHAGWDWDNHLSGFVAQSGVDSFDCTCGQKIAAPSYKTCSCGKMWNSTSIKTADGHKLICREVPVRDALLASKS